MEGLPEGMSRQESRGTPNPVIEMRDREFPSIDELNNFLREKTDRRNREPLDYNIGDFVEFGGKDGRIMRGIITKLNKKTVSIKTTTGVKWNVSPYYLRKSNLHFPGVPFPRINPVSPGVR